MGHFVGLTAADGHHFSAFRAEPDGKPKGAVVVVQEIFGVNAHIRAVTQRFAALGYVAVAPAIFDRAERGFESGYGADERPKAVAFLARPDFDGWLKDIAAARDSVASAGPVAIIGFCLGGSLAYLAATRLEGFSAAVAYYGGYIPRFADETPKIPVLAHFGVKDDGIPVSAVDTIRKKQPSLRIHIYSGAGHAFNRDPDRHVFDADAAMIAWGHSLAFIDAAFHGEMHAAGAGASSSAASR
jgi:carboxymethylenebutenolidase